MNNIYNHNNTRLYQTSYDDDEQGSIISINSDPYGILITYIGYALLFIAQTRNSRMDKTTTQ